MKVYMVVGAGYGDEGKGLTTDWLCSQVLTAGGQPLVVRANGGTQAAHTVQTPEGARHVFHHHGSGGFLRVPTFLSRHFLVNPIGFRMELDDMPPEASGKIYCDPRAHVALPIDMMLNQMMEQRRGAGKHGSCGWGIGETVQRGESHLVLTVAELAEGRVTVEFLQRLTQSWLPKRLAQLGLAEEDLSAEWRERLHDEKISKKWIRDVEVFLQETTLLYPRDLDLHADTLVFEGAQGLGLHEEGEHFPHVTRSRTGCENPLEVLQELTTEGRSTPVTALEVVYVTRCYATRHGAGPLEHEGEPHGCAVEDPTNIPNAWQDSLRSAPIDLELTSARISKDFCNVLDKYPTAMLALMMTCIDQATAEYNYKSSQDYPVDRAHPAVLQGRMLAQTRSLCLQAGYETYGCAGYASLGPTRETVQVVARMNRSLRPVADEIMSGNITPETFR